MHLSSIFKEYGVEIDKTKIVRHPLNNKEVQSICNKNMLEDYQSTQSKNVFDKCKFIASFVGTFGTEARFIGIYEIKKVITGNDVKKHMPKGYPYPEHFDNNHTYYQMKKTNLMEDMIDKLYIDWGKSTVAWVQWARTDKEVLSIMSEKEEEFPGYEKLIVSYSVLGKIVDGDVSYQKWRDALSNINGIYLICDTKHNKQYIGSTYNKGGILNRWTEYYKTHDDGDIEIRNHLKKHPKSYLDFQFTIMKILSDSITMEEAIKYETLYKDKLCTLNKDYGLNLN